MAAARTDPLDTPLATALWKDENCVTPPGAVNSFRNLPFRAVAAVGYAGQPDLGTPGRAGSSPNKVVYARKQC